MVSGTCVTVTESVTDPRKGKKEGARPASDFGGISGCAKFQAIFAVK